MCRPATDLKSEGLSASLRQSTVPIAPQVVKQHSQVRQADWECFTSEQADQCECGGVDLADIGQSRTTDVRKLRRVPATAASASVSNTSVEPLSGTLPGVVVMVRTTPVS